MCSITGFEPQLEFDALIFTITSGMSITQTLQVQSDKLYYILNKRDEILVLTPDQTSVTKYGDNSTINRAIDDYNSFHHNLSVPLFLLITPVYINITLKACPTGFSLTRSSPFYCTCDQQLASLEGKFSVSCDIYTQTVQRRGTVWIGVSGNTTDGNGVIVTKYCPYYYCSELLLL